MTKQNKTLSPDPMPVLAQISGIWSQFFLGQLWQDETTHRILRLTMIVFSWSFRTWEDRLLDVWKMEWGWDTDGVDTWAGGDPPDGLNGSELTAMVVRLGKLATTEAVKTSWTEEAGVSPAAVVVGAGSGAVGGEAVVWKAEVDTGAANA